MQRNLTLNQRNENSRNKVIVKQKVVEFDLEDIKKHFDDNINNIEQTFGIVDKLIELNEEEKSKNIMRSQIVFLVSAFDFYVHELTKYGFIKMFCHEWESTNKYNEFQVDMSLLEQAINKPESYDWFLNYINERFKRITFMSYKQIREQFELLGIDLDSIMQKTFDKTNYSNYKKVFKDLTDRRNEIAHQSDRSHYDAKQNTIFKHDVEEFIDFVKKIVEAIQAFIISK